jgi:hypothetical protein
MLQFAIPIRLRTILIAGAVGLGLMVAAGGGLTWYFLRCDVQDYFHRAATSPSNPQERYLFACRYVWRSTDGGRVWARLSSSGLPFGTRDGYIAIDLQPRTLYLGILIPTSSSIYCWNCAWKYLRPAIYTSTDGGHTWTFAYRFKRGLAGNSNFIGLYGDPEREGRVWAVIRNSDEITYYGSGTGGRFWKRTCGEFYFVGSGRCTLPKPVMEFAFPGVTVNKNTTGGQ